MRFRSMKDFDFPGKNVIVRVDLNVPLKDGEIEDDTKIKAVVPTIKYLADKGAEKITLMSHLGRPKGQFKEDLRMDPVCRRLSEILGMEVKKADDCVDVKLPNSRIILLENLRFHKEESDDDEEFAKKLASYADLYINDAFATCHRLNASVHAITRFLPAAAGLLLEKEINSLSFDDPKRPFIFILGGAKLDTKIPIIENMLQKSDKILLGGAMIFNFYKARGLEIGESLFEESMLGKAKEIMEKAGEKIVLPVDLVAAYKIEENAESEILAYDKMKPGLKGLDIGPETIKLFSDILDGAGTIIWNGPMGVFEIKQFAKGTLEIAKILSKLDAVKIVGGGDSAAAIEILGMKDAFTHISTGGGAALEMLSGRELPALKALEENMDGYE